jgi:hypothetical protein
MLQTQRMAFWELHLLMGGRLSAMPCDWQHHGRALVHRGMWSPVHMARFSDEPLCIHNEQPN